MSCHLGFQTQRKMPSLPIAGGILQRKCACGQHTIGGNNCTECGKKRFSLQRARRASPREGRDNTGATAIVHEVLRSPGRPLAPQTRDFFEPRFGRDFSIVQTFSRAAFSLPSRLSIGVQTSATGGTVLQRQAEVAESEPAESQTESAAAEERPETGEEQLAGVAEYPQLAALAARATELADTVRAVARDNGVPGRTTAVGSTTCNPNTGQPEWRIDRSRIPRCMWPCAEHHEQTHAEFMRMPCERVWLPIARAMFWIRIATQYAQQGNVSEVERAMRESEAAVAEGRREVNWYVMYMAQTCRYDEATAYEAGIEMCDTDEVRRQCAANGESAAYTTNMAAWRRFMQNPPNCPAQPPPPPRRP